MELKEDLQKEITIYWWNMGKKTLDYKGSYTGYFLKRDIKVSRIKNKTIKGLRFSIPTYSTKIRLDSFSGRNIEAFDDAIKAFLAVMGDKALLINGYGRESYINYR